MRPSFITSMSDMNGITKAPVQYFVSNIPAPPRDNGSIIFSTMTSIDYRQTTDPSQTLSLTSGKKVATATDCVSTNVVHIRLNKNKKNDQECNKDSFKDFLRKNSLVETEPKTGEDCFSAVPSQPYLFNPNHAISETGINEQKSLSKSNSLTLLADVANSITSAEKSKVSRHSSDYVSSGVKTKVSFNKPQLTSVSATETIFLTKRKLTKPKRPHSTPIWQKPMRSRLPTGSPAASIESGTTLKKLLESNGAWANKKNSTKNENLQPSLIDSDDEEYGDQSLMEIEDRYNLATFRSVLPVEKLDDEKCHWNKLHSYLPGQSALEAPSLSLTHSLTLAPPSLSRNNSLTRTAPSLYRNHSTPIAPPSLDGGQSMNLPPTSLSHNYSQALSEILVDDISVKAADMNLCEGSHASYHSSMMGDIPNMPTFQMTSVTRGHSLAMSDISA